MSTSKSPDEPDKTLDPAATGMLHVVKQQREKKQEARRKGDQSVWSAVGMMGMVGWGIVLPTALGGFLGRYLDRKLGTTPNFAVLLLLIGLGMGCWNTWRIVNRERQE